VVVEPLTDALDGVVEDHIALTNATPTEGVLLFFLVLVPSRLRHLIHAPAAAKRLAARAHKFIQRASADIYRHPATSAVMPDILAMARALQDEVSEMLRAPDSRRLSTRSRASTALSGRSPTMPALRGASPSFHHHQCNPSALHRRCRLQSLPPRPPALTTSRQRTRTLRPSLLSPLPPSHLHLIAGTCWWPCSRPQTRMLYAPTCLASSLAWCSCKGCELASAGAWSCATW
jgi:hypothetical protein